MNWLFTFSIALALLSGFACCILVLIDWTKNDCFVIENTIAFIVGLVIIACAVGLVYG